MTQVYQTTRPLNPVPKPNRTPREMAQAERIRQLTDEGNTLWPRLFEAIDQGHAARAHRVLDQLLALQTECLAVMASGQQDAGELPQVA